jgi:ketosteroid isomerase-like protein
LVAEFLRRQREMYEGGPVDPVLELMAQNIVWHVPGTSPIAGEYRARLAVLDYFQVRAQPRAAVCSSRPATKVFGQQTQICCPNVEGIHPNSGTSSRPPNA